MARVGVTTKYSKGTKGEDDRARTQRSGTRFDGLRASGDLTEAQGHGGQGSEIQETTRLTTNVVIGFSVDQAIVVG